MPQKEGLANPREPHPEDDPGPVPFKKEGSESPAKRAPLPALGPCEAQVFPPVPLGKEGYLGSGEGSSLRFVRLRISPPDP